MSPQGRLRMVDLASRLAASLGLPHTVGTTVAQGSFLNVATNHEPVAALGAAAAQRLGIDRIFSGERIRV